MACPESLAALKAMQESLLKIELEMIGDSLDFPANTLQKVPDGWIEDIKRFTVANVDSTNVTAQLTGMETARYYIIKEIRFYASGTIAADAAHSLKETDTGIVFMQGYYNEGSFSMLTGNRNGIINRPLTAKPTVTLTSGTGMAAQTWYGSIKYYYRGTIVP